MRLGLGLILLVFVNHWAYAQESRVKIEKDSANESTQTEDANSAQTDKENSENKNVEKIQVTGSYIKRIDIEGPSPVVTIDKEAFNRTGTNTVSDLLRESAYFEQSRDEGAQSGNFRFHGQHGGNTLVLLNGMRIPKMGAPGRDFFNGVRSIPTNVIERVEILKDGSSALYGADAMAGAINFITKKDYDGAEVSVRTTVPEMGVGLEQNYTITYGQNYSRGSWFSTVQYIEQGAATQQQVGSNLRNPTLPGGVLASNGSHEFGKDEKVTFSSGIPCGTNQDGEQVDCRSNPFYFENARSPKQNLSALLSGRLDITSDLNMAVTAIYNRRQRQSTTNVLPITDNERSPTQQFKSLSINDIPDSAYGKLLAERGIDPNKAGEFYYKPEEEVGIGRRSMVEDSYTVQTKTEGFFRDTWSWSFENSAGYQQETTQWDNGILNKDVAFKMMKTGAWSPAAPFGQKNSLAPARVQPIEQYDSHMVSSRIFTSGELFDFADVYGVGGPMALAVGVDAQWEGFNGTSDEELSSGRLTVVNTPNRSGSRRVQSAFMELSAYPIQSLELQAAARFDQYSDFGGTFNPKFALAFRPNNKVLFRSSWGTNFHAPSVSNMNLSSVTSFERFDDNNYGGDGRLRKGVIAPVTRYRDPNLRPETGIHYNFGTVIQPNRNWAFTVDQWNFEGKGSIARINGARYTMLESMLSPEEMETIGATITRENGRITGIRAPEVINLGWRTIRGLDMKVDWNHKINVAGLPMNLSLRSTHSHFLVYKTKRFDVFPIENRQDLEWRNTTSANLRSGRNFYRLAARTIAGDTQLTPGPTRGSVATDYRPTYTEYDFTYSFFANWGGRLSLGVKNLLNSQPPIDQRAFVNRIVFSGFDNRTQQSPLRRRYFVSYSQTF